jgi:Flp pilus assembly protein protease CpaA
MDLIYLLAQIGGVLTIAALPILCLVDLRTRNIPDQYILLYLLAGSPVLALYLFGLPYTYLLISLAMCGVWILIRKTGAWGGGDTKFLMVFSLISPLNPLNLYQQTFQISFLIILGAVMLMTTVFTGNRKDLPMMIPIAVAIVLTMLIGILL